VDVCLAIGTSLCGMRSDGIAKSSCNRGGLVIINLQQTPYDEVCQLRLYGNLQTIIERLGKALGIKITKRICISNPYEWNK
jgi:NAD-dependent SIR2 family protein deacetylase